MILHEVIIQEIANTTTHARTTITAELESGHDPKGVSLTDAECAELNLKRADFKGERNYTLMSLRRSRRWSIYFEATPQSASDWYQSLFAGTLDCAPVL